MKLWRIFALLLIVLAFFSLGTSVHASDVFFLAKQDLAERLHVKPKKITLYESFNLIWSDTSLGCPQEGYIYAQIFTPGYQMIFRVRKEPYIYHTNTSSSVVLCPEETIPGQYLYYRTIFKNQKKPPIN